MSDNASLNEQNAANYIQEYFLLSTGVTIPVVTETEYSSNKTYRFISVGYTTLAESKGITVSNYDLGFSGYVIKSIGGNTYIVSGNRASVIGAAFGYLNRELDVEVYAKNCDSYRMNGSNYVIKGLNEIVVPDMDIATTDAPYAVKDGVHYEMGYVARAENIFGVSASAHQTLTYYAQPSIFNNPEDPANYHPKWFYDNPEVSDKGIDGVEQVCFTAHGDEQELQAMKEQFLSVMINHKYGLKRGYGTTYIFGMEDNVYRCDCSTCTQMKAKYGVDNATSVIFANSVAEMMKAWMETEEGLPYKKDFVILIDAYEADIGAPARYNEQTGKYEPIDELVVCNENVEVFFAPAHMDFKRSINDPVNAKTKEAFEGWKVCSPRGISLYLYQTNYRDPLAFFDTLSTMQELYQYLATAKINFIHNSGNGYNPVTPGWETLTTYVQSKLVKDVDIDVDAVIDEFFDNYYGIASEKMKEYFDSYMAWTKHLRDDNVYEVFDNGTYMWETMVRKYNYYSNEKLNEWFGYVQEALDIIQPIKDVNQEVYDKLYDRIILERIPICIQAQEFGDVYSITGYTNLQIRQLIVDDCARLNITSRGALGSMQYFYDKWPGVVVK